MTDDLSVSRPIPPGEPLPWSTEAKPLTADALRAAVAKTLEQPAYAPPHMIVHPQLHDRACDLLGVPHGTDLTQADMWRAADVELEAMTPEQREQVMADIWQLHAQHYGGW